MLASLVLGLPALLLVTESSSGNLRVSLSAGPILVSAGPEPEATVSPQVCLTLFVVTICLRPDPGDVAGPCPAPMTDTPPGQPIRSRLVGSYETTSFRIFLCRNPNGQYEYMGETRGRHPLSLQRPAMATRYGYLVRNGTTSYQIDLRSCRLRIADGPTTEDDERFTVARPICTATGRSRPAGWPRWPR
jgi:hypothetical protein